MSETWDRLKHATQEHKANGESRQTQMHCWSFTKIKAEGRTFWVSRSVRCFQFKTNIGTEEAAGKVSNIFVIKKNPKTKKKLHGEQWTRLACLTLKH